MFATTLCARRNISNPIYYSVACLLTLGSIRPTLLPLLLQQTLMMFVCRLHICGAWICDVLLRSSSSSLQQQQHNAAQKSEVKIGIGDMRYDRVDKNNRHFYVVVSCKQDIPIAYVPRYVRCPMDDDDHDDGEESTRWAAASGRSKSINSSESVFWFCLSASTFFCLPAPFSPSRVFLFMILNEKNIY